MMMRVYALYNRSRWLIYVLVVMGIALVAGGCVAIIPVAPAVPVNLPSIYIPSTGCGDPISSEQGVRLAGSWGSLLAFDTFIFSLTIWKTWRIGSVSGRNLINILMRDGAMYFAVMIMINIVSILAYLLPPLGLKGIITTTANALSGTMVSRMMLNIRDPHLTGYTISSLRTGDLPQVTTNYALEPMTVSSTSSVRVVTDDVIEDIGASDNIIEIPRERRQ
ncbi:hypothetical protein SERLA73DRAFT_184349 [Serpula lacrymans var. lacrymans S7.3]|uniref:Uncharacterized protein n=2 Tax=Serpula lacrymans var. lacrymans TaxID=341189 RepID=F8Q328_SERL3|nr:hypothetical protein SERLA73DRAFT_184349 [Serpula lacrymans var. lacrymans S7.3]